MSDGSPRFTGAGPDPGLAGRLPRPHASPAFLCAGTCWTWRFLAPPLEVRLPPALVDSMVYCPKGVLRAGPTDAARVIGDFWIDRFEVTQADFRRFVDATGYSPAGRWDRPPVDPRMG